MPTFKVQVLRVVEHEVQAATKKQAEAIVLRREDDPGSFAGICVEHAGSHDGGALTGDGPMRWAYVLDHFRPVEDFGVSTVFPFLAELVAPGDQE